MTLEIFRKDQLPLVYASFRSRKTAVDAPFGGLHTRVPTLPLVPMFENTI